MMETCKERLVALLQVKGFHISTAESCTGGLIAAAIVDVSGASNVFEEGYVTYSNRVKEKLLGVLPETIEMALGTWKETGSELTVSVTGCAGPGDAEDGTKAGTVYIGSCFQGKAKARGFVFDGGRAQVRAQSVEEALKFALERIESGE